MKPKRTFLTIFLLALLVGLLIPSTGAEAERSVARPMYEVSAYELIIAMNTLRVSYGLPALVEDPIINAVAQSTAEIMAANQMSWHIGDVSGRLQSAGFGGGAKVWATENFAVGGNHSIDTIMLAWADPSHMIPAVNPAYCAVGAGVAKSSNGMTYYVLQAAYTASKACGEYKSPFDTTPQAGVTPGTRVAAVSQLIVPVKVATPDAKGEIYHVVQAGQSFWSIAISYKITIRDIEIWNNTSRDFKLQVGQKLFIPSENTKGYATPTPVGMVVISTADANGKIVHSVQPYETLSSISQAYKVEIGTILALNGIQEDWPLQIGQQLIIQGPRMTATYTPLPLTPLQKLTPAADGKYYHTVQSGETLSWIASLYEITMFELMSWNGLNESSIIQPDQKLLLQVTPPATETPTPGPPTATPSATPDIPSATPSLGPSKTIDLNLTPTGQAEAGELNPSTLGLVILGVGIFGLVIALIFGRRMKA